MSVIEISERRRDHTFRRVAEAAIENGEAVGSPDETGWPQIRARVFPVVRCSTCGEDRPIKHDCTEGVDRD